MLISMVVKYKINFLIGKWKKDRPPFFSFFGFCILSFLFGFLFYHFF